MRLAETQRGKGKTEARQAYRQREREEGGSGSEESPQNFSKRHTDQPAAGLLIPVYGLPFALDHSALQARDRLARQISLPCAVQPERRDGMENLVVASCYANLR